jgi:hypothetical protein
MRTGSVMTGSRYKSALEMECNLDATSPRCDSMLLFNSKNWSPSLIVDIDMAP